MLMERYYHLYRWNHLLIFCVIAVLGGCLYGSEGYDESIYPTAALGGGITLGVELFYLWWNGWRISVTYLLLATTYVALMSGVAITAFKLARYLFAPGLND